MTNEQADKLNNTIIMATDKIGIMLGIIVGLLAGVMII